MNSWGNNKGITKSRWQLSKLRTLQIKGLETWPNLVFKYLKTITYHSNLNYDSLVFQTINFDGFQSVFNVQFARLIVRLAA